jgi:predicted ATPase/class 3 adenylate cyclase
MGAERAAPLPDGVVTLVFTDIEGSTKLLHEIGTAYGQVLDDHHRLLRAIWGEFGGVEVDTEGDAFFVAFPTVSSAVEAVTAAQTRLAAHHWPHGGQVRVRIGVHTGEPQQRDGTYWGIDVHYAARLCAAAHGGQVLLSTTARALVPEAPVDDLGAHAVKDFPSPRPLYHLVIDGRHRDQFPPPRTLEEAHTNLPSISTPLVGRDAELADLLQRLTSRSERLVTLIGPGGSGKTRLAVAAGGELVEQFADGVFLVALAPVTDSAGVPSALAEALSAARQAELGPLRAAHEHLKAREILLVLDNVEHVRDAVPLFSELLAAAPGLRILATSQAPLHVSAETVVPLAPLGLPVGEQADIEAFAETPAVALFVNRARAADPTFTLSAANAAAVGDLCRRLDGLPLALELAAARVRMAGVDGLLRALGRGVEALGRGNRELPERQRGLRAALDWTVSLLDDEQRELFAGLGAFASAWTLEQAERLFGANLDVWEAMAALLDFSLVQTRGDGRLTMAERVRRHAQELLAESGREIEVRSAHAVLVAEMLEDLHIGTMLDLAATIARSRDAMDEIERALAFSRENAPPVYRRLLAFAGRPLYFAGRLPQVAAEITRLARAEPEPDAIAGALMVSQAMIGTMSGGMDDVVAWTQRGIELLREHGSLQELVTAMSSHAHMLTLAWRGPEAREVIAEALGLAAGLPDPRVRDQLEGTIAFAAVVEGEWDEAETRLQEIMARPERTDFAARAAPSYLADVALGRRDYETALARYLRALDTVFAIGDLNNVVLQLAGIITCLTATNRDGDAARLLGGLQHLCDEVGMAPTLIAELGPYAEPLKVLPERLGQERYEQLTAEGRQLDLDQTLLLAHELAGVPAA